MKELIIIGAGAFGREVFAWAKQTPEYGTSWQIKGFLDDRTDSLSGYNYNAPILSSVESYTPKENDLFVCALGDPASKKQYTEVILKKGGRFTNIIHSTTVFGDNVTLGKGVIICPHVTISSDANVGNHVSINGKSGVGHDVCIGDWSCIQSYCDLTGFAKIGKSVAINTHAVILPGVEVCDNAIVGAGSIVIKKVGLGQTVFGNPALPLSF